MYGFWLALLRLCSPRCAETHLALLCVDLAFQEEGIVDQLVVLLASLGLLLVMCNWKYICTTWSTLQRGTLIPGPRANSSISLKRLLQVGGPVGFYGECMSSPRLNVCIAYSLGMCCFSWVQSGCSNFTPLLDQLFAFGWILGSS